MKASPTTTAARASTLLLVLLIVAGALAAAGCGEGSAVDTSASSLDTAAASSLSTAPAQSATGDGYIAFIGYRKPTGGHGQQIYLVRPDGSGLRQLTHEKFGVGVEGTPVWSPDGSRIAYLGPGGVWVVNADGSGQHQVDSSGYRRRGGLRGFDWSPDGRRLVLGLGLGDRLDRHDRLATINLDGSGFRVLISLRGHLASAPVCAPDGRIYFGLTRGDPEIATISSIESDGSDYAVLTTIPPAYDRSFSLSRDGRWLALFGEARGAVLMAANGNGRKSVFLAAEKMAAVAGEKDRIIGGFFGVASSWSPDGTRVAIASNGAPFGNSSSLYIARVDGSGVRKVPGTGQVINPSWQPR